MDIFSIFFNMKVYQYTIMNTKKKKKKKKKIIQNFPKSAAMGFFQGTQEQIRNSRGKRAISARATEGLL